MENLSISVKSVINKVRYQKLDFVKKTPADFMSLSEDEMLAYYRKVFDSVISACNVLSALDDLLDLVSDDNNE